MTYDVYFDGEFVGYITAPDIKTAYVFVQEKLEINPTEIETDDR